MPGEGNNGMFGAWLRMSGRQERKNAMDSAGKLATTLAILVALACGATAGAGTRGTGKKAYPAGTRERWIREGRALGSAPEGMLPTKKAPRGAADNRGYLPPIGDQGAENTCVHWAGTYYAKTANMKRKDPGLDVNSASNQCSPRFTYNLTNGGEDSGSYGHEPFELFMRYGVPSLAQLPTAAGDYASLPAAEDFAEGLHRRTTNYVWAWDWEPDAGQVAELKAFLDAGGVAVAALCADGTFDDWEAGDAPWAGPNCGYGDMNHVMAVCGYGPGYYLLANSYGPGYGSNGFIHVDATYFETKFADAMYPLEGSYEPAESHATLRIGHGRRSDLRSLAFSVNGATVWSNAPLPTWLPKGQGGFVEDERDGWELAVELRGAAWGTANAVTARVVDSVSGTAGAITNFAVWFNGTNHESSTTPAAIPDNTGVPGVATATFAGPPPAWDDGYQDLGGGWRRLGWFGDYAVMALEGWIWHSKHGFFYVADTSAPGDVWLYADDMGWLYTGNGLYPFLYRASDGAWIWYNGATSPRWFMNFTAGQWESWP